MNHPNISEGFIVLHESAVDTLEEPRIYERNFRQDVEFSIFSFYRPVTSILCLFTHVCLVASLFFPFLSSLVDFCPFRPTSCLILVCGLRLVNNNRATTTRDPPMRKSLRKWLSNSLEKQFEYYCIGTSFRPGYRITTTSITAIGQRLPRSLYHSNH